MSLDTYVRELFTPGRSIKNSDQFWDRYGKDVLQHKDVQKMLTEAAPADRKILEKRIETITKENFQKYGANYFEGSHTGSNILRYGALGVNVIGGITAAGGILALAAGGPLTALGAIGLGLGYLITGATVNTAADMYDAAQIGKAMNGRYEPSAESKGVVGTGLNYVRKLSSGLWDVVSAPFRKSTYSSIKALAEGIVTNAFTAGSSALFGNYFGGVLGPVTPYTQIGAMFAGSAISFYRGRKKFEDGLIDKIVKTSQDTVLDQISEEPMKRPKMLRLEDVYGTNFYDALRKRNNDMNYISPRKVA